MYKLDLPLDTRESFAIERRKNMERNRQARIFNAKERTIGVDIKELDKQVNEKKERKNLEKEHSAAFGEEMIRNSKVAEILQERKEKEAKEINASLVEYWQENQRPQDRREYDLNDHDSKLKDLPARVSDSDPRNTVSGMQTFSGEDLDHQKRKGLQHEQMRDWLSQQMEEKRRLSMEKKKADHLYDVKAIEIDERAQELLKADEITRRTLNVAIKEYNQALAKEREAHKQQSLIQEIDDNFTEIRNNVSGDILTENPSVAQSALGQQRVIPDRWKGMSQSDMDKVRQTQAEQREEKKHIKMEEKRLEEEWDRRRVAEAKAGLVLEAQERQARKQLAEEHAEQNKLLAAEQRAKQDIINQEVYVNTLSDNYFTQFGTSSR
ncbi:PREDICTED: RIB43A-like with coiled-coils protein 2 [Amphimedon queenslandica]|uniref:RIB43A-like with coiled-coils protein 2 n=1 Tax=Amphimedon queenslandica TaxID=400682 RepID=A0A1X7U059_AMPQE|nr:PREDICTED: RIB43A-like with coiled-coils protein 2 [Amphimedon queenslandica]|eukprot:XP_003389344.1 PREDICTED: RIB43A-like with coiled-coils protein 2 [Amphimedon queenslandica]